MSMCFLNNFQFMEVWSESSSFGLIWKTKILRMEYITKLPYTFLQRMDWLMLFNSWYIIWKTPILQTLFRSHHCTMHQGIILSGTLGSVQDFLIKLDMKQRMHLVEISIFSLNLVIIRLTKIYEQSRQKLGTILGNKVS